MIIWEAMHPKARPHMLGYLTGFLNSDDPRTAREQLHTNYVAGWCPFKGFTLDDKDQLLYPGDPPLPPLFRTRLRDEEIMFYDCSWVMVRQADGSFEVARMD